MVSVYPLTRDTYQKIEQLLAGHEKKAEILANVMDLCTVLKNKERLREVFINDISTVLKRKRYQ